MIEVEFVLEDAPDRQWLTQVLFAGIAHELRFNAGRFTGTYRILPGDPTEEIVQTATEDIDRTELLADAIEHYVKFRPEHTEFYLMATYTTPHGNCQSGCRSRHTPDRR